MSMKLYVGNLSFNTSKEALEEIFGSIGRVESTNVIEDRETGRSRGFAFVEMSSADEAREAIKQLNGKKVFGRMLKVNEVTPKSSSVESEHFVLGAIEISENEAWERDENNRYALFNQYEKQFHAALVQIDQIRNVTKRELDEIEQLRNETQRLIARLKGV